MLFFQLNNQFFALSLTLLKHEMNKQGFIFEVIQSWPVINLFNLIHEYLFLISLEIVVGYRKLRRFQGTQTNLSVLLEKTDITYPSRNSYCGISRAKLHN